MCIPCSGATFPQLPDEAEVWEECSRVHAYKFLLSPASLFHALILSGKDESLIMSSHLGCGIPIGFTLYLPDIMSKFRIGAMFHILTPSNLLIDV